MPTLLHTPTTLFRDRAKAEEVAAAVEADDPGTEYRVEPAAGGRYVIAIYDGAEFIACL